MKSTRKLTGTVKDLLNFGITFQENHRFSDAKKVYESVLEQFPENHNALHLLGMVMHQMGNSREGIKFIELAIEKKSGIALYYHNCAQVYQEIGEYEEAIKRFSQALKIKPEYPEASLKLGKLMMQAGRYDDAITHFKQALSLVDYKADIYNQVGQANYNLNRFDSAIANYNLAIKHDPEHAEALNNAGTALTSLEKYEDAIDSFNKALKINPDYVKAHSNLGLALSALGDGDGAMMHYDRALEINPLFVPAYNNKGILLMNTGKRDESIACFKKALELNENYSRAERHLSMVDSDQARIPIIKQKLSRAGILKNDLINYHFGLGNIYEKNSSYDEAFIHYKKANDLVRGSINYSRKGFSSHVDRLISTYTTDYIKKIKEYGNKSDVPVFVVGMPRSGTTLVDQIISSHPDVSSVGERRFMADFVYKANELIDPGQAYPECMASINKKIVSKLSAEYLALLKSSPGNAIRVVDKTPGNFIRIGLIKTLFPNAKIVHCSRSPLDTCLSIYTRYFHYGHEYSYNLIELGNYYHDYQRLMLHWKTIFTEDIYEVIYENLVNNQEKLTREILKFLNLDWSENCLNFYRNKRVIQTDEYHVLGPIHSRSVDKWKNYEPHLQPLADIIATK